MNSNLDFRQGTNICLRVVRGVGQTDEGGGEDSLRGSGVRIRIKKMSFQRSGGKLDVVYCQWQCVCKCMSQISLVLNVNIILNFEFRKVNILDKKNI